MTRLLNVEQVSMMTGWKPATIYQKAWRREIAFVKLGRNLRFKEDTINKLIEESVVPQLEHR